MFARDSREDTIHNLAEVIQGPARRMHAGQSRSFSDPFPFRLSRLSDSGDLYFGWISNTSIDTFEEMDELDRMLADNARKFKGLEDLLSWLVVCYLGTEHGLRLIGPSLKIPPIDSLFFIVYEESKPRIVEYNAIWEPDAALTVDRELRAVRTVVPFLQHNRS